MGTRGLVKGILSQFANYKGKNYNTTMIDSRRTKSDYYKYFSFFIDPKLWLRALKRPNIALESFLVLLRYPHFYAIGRNMPYGTGFVLGSRLYKTVLDTKCQSPNVIEVGAWKGESTIYLSLAAKRAGKRVRTFELFSGLPTINPEYDSSFEMGQFSAEVSEFENNVKTYGCREVVDLVIGDARQTMLPAIGDGGFCVAFLDVDVYEVMRELLFQLWSKAKGGEQIIVHDIWSPGVRKAVDEFHDLSGHCMKESIDSAKYVAFLQLPLKI